MTDKVKNIITNLIGLLLLGFGGYLIFLGKIDFIAFCGMVVISIALFTFKASVTKEYIKKFLDKKLK
jgi:glucose dehydrogenase